MKNDIADFYLEFLNDWLTVESYAEYHDMSMVECQTLINLGREFHEQRVEK